MSIFLLCAPSCGATVNKSTASVVVSTKNQDNWYDLGDKSLHTFAVCDSESLYDYDSGKLRSLPDAILMAGMTVVFMLAADFAFFAGCGGRSR